MLSLMLWLSHAGAEQLGEVDTVFKLLSPNHEIVVDAHDDPKVSGVTCYVSRAKTGGFKGAVGFAEDKAEASIACHQGRAISFLKPLTIQCAARREARWAYRQHVLFTGYLRPAFTGYADPSRLAVIINFKTGLAA